MLTCLSQDQICLLNFPDPKSTAVMTDMWKSRWTFRRCLQWRTKSHTVTQTLHRLAKKTS